MYHILLEMLSSVTIICNDAQENALRNAWVYMVYKATTVGIVVGAHYREMSVDKTRITKIGLRYPGITLLKKARSDLCSELSFIMGSFGRFRTF